MHGKIWAQSELGKGSQFFFTIYCPINHASVRESVNFVHTSGARTVLVINSLGVDDDVVRQVEGIGLRALVCQSMGILMDKDETPELSAVIADSAKAVRFLFLLTRPLLIMHSRSKNFGPLSIFVTSRPFCIQTRPVL
jgi:osomolarity two-component system, sensor histidine kinase NIK1